MWKYNYTPEPNELYHWGIKGQKWGQRRYRNKDGTLTPAGKKRYAKETFKTENKNALERQQNSLKKLQSSGRGNDIDAVMKISNQYDADRKAAREKYKAEKKSIKAEKWEKEQEHEDYTRAHSPKSIRAMSNAELNERNKRLNAEKQYKQLTATTSKGKKIVKGITATAGTTAALYGAYKKTAPVVKAAVNKADNYVIKDLNKGLNIPIN